MHNHPLQNNTNVPNKQAIATPAIALTAILGCVLAGLLLLLGSSIGSAGWHNPLHVLSEYDSASALQDIVWNIRLPRAVGALLAGALLGLSGAIAQGLFRNPLADPYLLGSAAGASLLVALTMYALGTGAGIFATSTIAKQASVFGSGWLLRLGLTGAAFVGSVGAVALTLVLARGAQNSLRLLLAGVVVGVILGAATQLIMLISPDVLQGMQAFMLGSTAFVGWSACGVMVAVLLPSLLFATMGARVLDALSLGEATAQSLGMPLQTLRMLLVLLLALTAGTAVAQTGLIAFVGLAAPHLARNILRVGYRHLLWLSALLGGLLLLSADIAARWIIAPQELAVGIVTALVGGLYLLILMHRQGQSLTGGM